LGLTPIYVPLCQSPKRGSPLDFARVFLHQPPKPHKHGLVKDDDIDMAFVENLLADMKAGSKPPKPSQLGVIGKEHLTEWMIKSGGVAEKTIKYQRTMGTDESGMPYVIEMAFGVQKKEDASRRILRTGMNWTPALGDPIPTLTGVIQEMRIDYHDPVTLVVHLARPRFEFVDRGKTRVDW
jgi:hypothetical protein